ncbi:unnamed protein product [Sphagnum jensenii]|uniref:Capsid protein n=1 Tax=Sphagnum jensenii TaxID=128206 RepID=A0ABP0VGQ9_9BRYO
MFINGDAANKVRRGYMTDLEIEQASEVPAEVVEAAIVDKQAPEYTKAQVSKIVERERLKALEKGRRDALMQLQQDQVQQAQAPQAQPMQAASSIGGMQQLSQADIERMIAQRTSQLMEQQMHQVRNEQVAQSFFNKMQAAESRHPGLEQKLNDLDYESIAPLIMMANNMENTADVIAELIDNPMKMGDTVTFDTTPRYISYAGLQITEQPSVQRVQSLICSQAANVSSAYTDQQFIFNVRDYMDRFGSAAVKELGSLIEADVQENYVSGVQINNPQDPNFGSLQYQSGPFRFYGDGVTPINSFTQLAQSIANFDDFGAATYDKVAILPVATIPSIVGTGLNQFAVNRNNETAYDWELGRFSQTDWHESNLLPTHVAGTIGNAASPNNVLTVISVGDPTGQNVLSITFQSTGDPSDADAIKAGDLLQFNDISGYPNMRFLTFIGHRVSQQPVQFRAIADAATDSSGVVTVFFQTINSVGLVWAQNQNQNLNNTIVPGMQVSVLPSHRAGILMSGNQFYLAMPRLPDESPFTTSTMVDDATGASIRHYFGSQFGMNNRAYVRDCVWGSCLVPENSLRYIFPM